MARDYYDVLGVERGANEADIKRAFRALARELHPDVNSHDPEAEEKFKQAAEAYEVLSDSSRRQTYDTFGHDGLRSGGWAPQTEGFGNIGDLFQAFFGAEGPGGDPFGFGQAGAATGADIGTEVELTLAEVLTGAQRQVAFEAIAPCERCRGNGAEPGTPIKTCEKCEGSGQIRQMSRSVFGTMVRASVCDVCGGDGRVPESPCTECRGSGRVAAARTYEVDVPAGIEDGQRIRIAGAGHAGDPGGGDGDLYVQVRVGEDERFERHGSDLLSRIPVPVTTAMLGDEIEVPTLDGEQTVKIAAGTQNGDTVRLKGQGLPRLQNGRRGDQHVVFDLVVPSKLSKKQREAARALREELGE